VQRGKGLEAFEYLDGHYLLPGDGTGFFASNSIHCDNCCVKHHHKCHIQFGASPYKKNMYLLIKPIEAPWVLHYIDHEKQRITLDIDEVAGLKELLRDKAQKELSSVEKAEAIEAVTAYHRQAHPDEEVSYYHQMFCAAIVHPDHKLVLPLAPEPIMKTDGASKNDCERNASKRLYADARREHPHLKFIVVEDSLASNVPHLRDLNTHDMRYIVGAKPGDHQFLFEHVKQATCTEYSHTTQDGKTHRYRYINDVPLNKSHPDFRVNFMEYWETDKKGVKQHFSWVTDLTITNNNVYDIMRGGRINWRIENNTFNTLKNQDYHFEHNFGHGYKNLSTVFGTLMMLAFFVDQVQALCCDLFKKARAKFKSLTSLWEKIRGMFKEFLIGCWDDVFHGIAHGYNRVPLVPNTS
jgi:hypothetical protein